MPQLGPLTRSGIEGRCHDVTRSTFNRFESRLVWVAEPAVMKPSVSTVSFEEWCRVFTLIKGHGTGYNDTMDRWISTPALQKLYLLTYGQSIDFKEWGVKGTGDFGNQLGYCCHVWTDAIGCQWLRLPNPGRQPREFKFPAVEWAFRDRENPDNCDFAMATTKLIINMLESDLQKSNYIHELLSPFLGRYPATECNNNWARQLRSEIWAMLVIHFPLGIDADYLLPAYRVWSGQDLTAILGKDVSYEVFVDHIICDLVHYERETICTGVVFPKLFKRIQRPPLIQKSLDDMAKEHRLKIKFNS